MKANGHPVRQGVRALRDQPNRLPNVGADVARLTRLLCDARLGARLREVCGVGGWHVAPAADAGDDLCWIVLQYAGGRASIGLDAAAHPALASLAGESATPLACAVAGLLLTPLIALLESFGAADVAVVAVGRHGGEAPASVVVRCLHDDRRYTCRLALPEPGWIDLIERRLALHRPPLPRRLGDILVPGYLLVGEKRLAIGKLKRLRPGDVVLRFASHGLQELEGRSPVPALELHWGPGGTHRYVARATLDGPQLVLDTDPAMTYQNDRPDSDMPDAQTQTSIDELDLPVRFEIETVALPLAQLSALRAGYVVELPRTIRDARVRLVSYGQLIGSGELVTVGEQLGVRIVEMFGSHDAD